MDVQEAQRDADEVIFVDVREPDEWDAGHIEGALHVPMGEIVARVDDFDVEERYVAVCRSGARSDQVARFLQGQGIDIENLEGGMQAWQRSGLPMVAEGDHPPRVA